MSHANAALTPRHRLRLARLVVDEGWTVAAAARFFRVSWPTADRWASRYAAMGEAGMQDRSSRPHHSPMKTPRPLVKRIIALRWRKRMGAVEIAGQLRVSASTVHSVLVRARLNRLSHVDVRTGEPVRRYEHEYPGAMIHVDVKKLGNIPDGGGWRFVGRQQGDRNRAATPGKPRTANHGSGPRSCTPSSMTTPGSRMPRSMTTRKPSPRSVYCAEPRPGSSIAE